MFTALRRHFCATHSCLARLHSRWLDATGAAAAGTLILVLMLPAVTASRAEADMARRGALAVASAAIAGGGNAYLCCNSTTGACLLHDSDVCPPGFVLVADGDATCMPNPCPQGRCCDPFTGGCTITGPMGCVGDYLAGGLCEPNMCIGACCDPVSGACRLTGPVGCIGPFTIGAACEPSPCPMVACCDFVTGVCTMTGPAGCFGGPPVPGAACTPNPCPLVACCNFGTGLCTMTPPGGCAGGPSFGSTCEPNPCPVVACCDLLTGQCTITGPGGCTSGPPVPATSCTPNPCPGACCDAMTSQCTMLPRGQCTGTWSPMMCGPNVCAGACCNLLTGECRLTTQINCSFGDALSNTEFIWVGGVCGPTTCPSGACCNSTTGACTVTGPEGCFAGYQPNGVCNPNPCPGACCSTTTGLCTYVAQGACAGAWTPGVCTPSFCPPVAKAKDVIVDVRGVCASTEVVPTQVDDGSFSATPMCPVSLTLIPSGPYPIGVTPVTLKVTDCNGKMSTATATITVLGTDCDHNGINDFCECYWTNADLPLMRTLAPAPLPAGGQLSHIGGGTPGGSRVADDFWVCAGQVHRISGFSGLMLTNSTPGLRKARLEFYEDCDGRPAAEPFFVSTKSTVAGQYPGVDGLAMVEYSFDLCDEPLWLDGGACGKTYWVALIGLTDNTGGGDVSYWITAPSFLEMIGSVPVKADGSAGPTWGSVIWGPWAQVDECCGGCVNMAFTLRGSACKVLWENGPPDLTITRGGTFSGAAGAGTARTADNFVVPPCDPVHVCLIEAWVWTNCIPPHGTIEIYGNDCNVPGEQAGLIVPVDRAVETTETATIDGVTYRLYKLQAYPVGLHLAGGRTYWLSAVVNSGGSLNGRTLFAYTRSVCSTTLREGETCSVRISPGATRAITPVRADEWTIGTRDYAFRVAIHPPVEATMTINPNPSLPTCRADTDRNGAVTVDDLFMYLNLWFVGCP